MGAFQSYSMLFCTSTGAVSFETLGREAEEGTWGVEHDRTRCLHRSRRSGERRTGQNQLCGQERSKAKSDRILLFVPPPSRNVIHDVRKLKRAA